MAEQNPEDPKALGEPMSDSDDEISTEWDRVQADHQQLVEALNETPVSFTVRSAEGLAMYEGLDSHSANGHMRDLAKKGRIAWAARVQRKRALDEGNAESLLD